ncbi:hypothetical protein [Burkholderia glumae]|uniref:Uncharacterized protein n=1 Tax=Burkholderia glumae TaxID=337 RepID=A0ABY5B9U9_BURGL|nr:hypothetical protein [Burkholderia glumae]MCM2485499.1 hypothetical protein [Burkholderia glumae]MCM2511193.1 hypothetical protein [Burkholderia glumae]MCM2541071.1 hypothetical protein [Burkholderia glumae]USS43805.1 hypothetical protein NFI99_05015 [Burkholderia glumae]
MGEAYRSVGDDDEFVRGLERYGAAALRERDGAGAYRPRRQIEEAAAGKKAVVPMQVARRAALACLRREFPHIDERAMAALQIGRSRRIGEVIVGWVSLAFHLAGSCRRAE